ncbi:MAG: magnesium chelatase [Acidobacteria bacterium]|nr:magnesium chelatase [Acidobacteriota bacterium]
MSRPRTLGELRATGWAAPGMRKRTVKEEMRANVVRQLEAGNRLFPGIVGYDDSVVPQVVNAILSRHNLILLGLRGQAKSRILRGLTQFLDEEIPVMAGCEINDNPFRPHCRACRNRVEEMGNEAPVSFLPREARYVEKLATPDVTIADMIGDVDPIRAARSGLDLADELTIHYGLLPRANRGLFAINELPDLAGKIQVGLFNILQEGDVQIKGYPVRFELDVVMVFTANPEDYTARGKIITPLKDRIGAEVRTHYPAALKEGIRITEQEAWLERPGSGNRLRIPRFIQEVIETIAFLARRDKKVDKRSGVSQRLPITVLENVVSNAERRCIASGEKKVVPRISDVYAALPSMTGKLELEYEGELQGAEKVARDLVRGAVGKVFSRYYDPANLKHIVDWFDLGGALKLSESGPTSETFEQLNQIQGLVEKTASLEPRRRGRKDPAFLVSGCEFILDGLHALRKIDRSEDKGYFASEKKRPQTYIDDRPARRRRSFN